jgi:putative ABC transport system permease protein
MKNKGRMLMSVLGIMGCSGLIIAALTLNTTMKGISKIVYEEVYSYDHIALLDSKTTDKDLYNLHIKGITQHIEETVMQAVAENGERRMTHVSVLTKNSPLFHLSGLDGKPVVVPEEGILITRKLAETLHVDAGDKIALKKTDDSYYEVEIKQVIYMVSGQGIYMARDYWEALGETYKPTSLFIKWQTDDYSFLKSDYVKSYTSITEQKGKFDENLKILFTSVAMLISSGGILAFVVLYNLGVLNFYERVRDLATLKVLGFYKKEISSLVLIENIVSAVIGILAGVPLGGVLVKIITRGFGESLDLISIVKLENVLMAGGITFVFVMIVNVVVQKKINTIDMLEALKSVE